MAILDSVVSAQQSNGDRIFRGNIASAGQVRVAHGKFATYLSDHIAKIGAMAHVLDKRAILVVNSLPVRAVHLGVVKIFALDAPCFTEDLFPLRARINAHLDGGEV